MGIRRCFNRLPVGRKTVNKKRNLVDIDCQKPKKPVKKSRVTPKEKTSKHEIGKMLKETEGKTGKSGKENDPKVSKKLTKKNVKSQKSLKVTQTMMFHWLEEKEKQKVIQRTIYHYR